MKDRKNSLGVLILLPALLAVVVFVNTLQNGFVYDDAYKIQQLPDTLPSPGDLLFLRSVPYVTQVLDKRLWGTWAPGFHLTSALLHALASTLAACAALSLSRSRRVAVLTGVFFAVHPVHVEAVASFANRKDVLAMIFASLTLLLWRHRRFPVWSYAGAVVCFGLGLLSKEVAVAGLVPMLFLSDLLLGKEATSGRRRLGLATLRILPFLLAAAGTAAARLLDDLPRLFSPEAILEATKGELHGYDQVLANSAAAVPELLRLLFWPLELSADYPIRLDLTLTHPKALLGLGLALLWIGASLILVRRAPLAGFAMLWTLVMVLPCTNLVPLIHYFIAERYLYVPSFGVCLLLAIVLDRGLVAAEIPHLSPSGAPALHLSPSGGTNRRAAMRLAIAVLAAALIVLGGGRSAARNRDWHDDYSLWTSAIRAGYGTVRSHYSLGLFHQRQGNYDLAIDQYRRSWLTMVGSLMAAGRLEEASAVCEKVLAARPEDVACRYTLGEIEVRRGNRRRAIGYYRQVLAADPNHLGALVDLARLLATAPEAVLHDRHARARHWRDGLEALRLSERARRTSHGEDPEVLLTLAVSYDNLGHYGEAAEWGREAHRLAQAQGLADLASKIERYLQRPLGGIEGGRLQKRGRASP